jgi:peptide/nickel transport system permease protein
MTVKRILSNSELMLGILIVLAFAAVAVAAPTIAPPEGEDPYVMPKDGYSPTPKPPSADHPLGTMEDQYDMLYGLIWGTRVAFRVGVLITLGRALIGVLVGVISGYYGGRIDALIMRITDAFLAFPIVAAVLLMLTVSLDYWGIRLGEGDRAIVSALVLFGWMQYARLVRGNVLAERAKEYVEAAISIGGRDRRIIFRHVLPNATQGLFVLMASDVGAMVVTIAALTFIGISGEQPTADWGEILKSSRNWVIGAPTNAFEYWYSYIPPIMAIVFFSIGWSLIGDGLRQATDPRRRGFPGFKATATSRQRPG